MRLRAIRLLLPRPTARLRLTLFYGGLFLISGIAVLAVTYALVWHATDDVLVYRDPNGAVLGISRDEGAGEPSQPGGQVQTSISSGNVASGSIPLTPEQMQEQDRLIEEMAAQQRADQRLQLVTSSGLALAATLVLSMISGWLVAGRVLRPVRNISATVRRISAGNLHERLALRGPDDEFKELGNTLDDLLGRLEAAFEGQRQFVANASHELRTPLTVQRALLQVALADPKATSEELRSTCEKVLESEEQQRQLIDALFTLARSDRGLDRREPIDLAAVVEDVLGAHAEELEAKELIVESRLSPAVTLGGPSLVASLVANLVDNAIQHNVQGGNIHIETTTRDGGAILLASNSGPLVAAEEIERLLQPFQRLAVERTTHGGVHGGHGLGLAIVKAVAMSHGAKLEVRPRDGGGIEVEVRFAACEDAGVCALI
jgi:signal transduction histidine kinase